MPQPTKPASVRITQYCPFCQRLLMPMAQPFLNWIGREMVRGRGSLMGESSARSVSNQPGDRLAIRENRDRPTGEILQIVTMVDAQVTIHGRKHVLRRERLVLGILP